MQHNGIQHSRLYQDNQRKRTTSLETSVAESPRPQQPIRVFIANQRAIVRAGVRAFLERERTLTVVGEADDAEKALSEAQRTKPQIILLESGLAGSSDTDLFTRLYDVLPSVRIISLMGDNTGAAFRRSVEGGAQGYLGNNMSQKELVQAIRTVAKGDAYLGPESVNQAFSMLRQQQTVDSSPSGVKGLSPQEQRVIALLADGNTNKEIAAKLMLSEKTVKNYIANIFTKLGVERRTHAVALYYQAQRDDMCATMMMPG